MMDATSLSRVPSNETGDYNIHDDWLIMMLINISVLTLGNIGIIMNGFSLFVLWKCMTTGQLGIKLMLISDLVVCVAYVAFNVQSNIVNKLSHHINDSFIVKLATVNRLSIHVALFVSNWWIIALLLLRVLAIFSPVNVKSCDKMLYHWLLYLVCWVTGIVFIVPLRLYERYMRVVIHVVPVILVSVEGGLIICRIRRIQSPSLSAANRITSSSYQEIPVSSSNSSVQAKVVFKRHRNTRILNRDKPYNNIVITILLLALNFLVLDSLLFIDTLNSISRSKVEPLPMWFMLLINIFSLSKRILNFVILCAKCRHFRKILNIKLNMLNQHFQNRLMRHRSSKSPIHGEPQLYAKGNEFILQSDIVCRHLRANDPLLDKVHVEVDSLAINSYYSAFEMSPCMSNMSAYHNRLTLTS